jgi:hypothetical protein
MKKNTLLFLILALCFSSSAYSQDTLRLFGHKESKETKPLPDTNVKAGPKPAKTYDPNEIQTLTGPGRSTGFYFGFNSSYSQIEGRNTYGFGGTLAIIANHGLAIGLSGTGFFSDPYRSIPGSENYYGYTGGYGGLLIKPILFPKYPVHISFPILLGGGAIGRSVLIDYNYPYNYTEFYVENFESFMIAEPGVEIEFNIARWMRLGVGATYRFTTTFSESSIFDSNPLNGFTGLMSLEFGKF